LAWLAVCVFTIAGAIVAYKLTGLESTQQLEPVGDPRHEVGNHSFVNINSGNVAKVSGDLHYHGSSFWPVFLLAGAAATAALFLMPGIIYTGSSTTTVNNIPPSDPKPSAPLAPKVSTQANIQAIFQDPGGCSSTYTVEGQVLDQPAAGNTLWVVAVLHADPTDGRKDALYYPKAQIPAQPGPYRIEVPANTEPGVRRGRFLLVIANEQAYTEMQLSYESDKYGDERYPSTKRWQLPAEILASTPESEQRCDA
jgi:hypothetical protein